MGQPLNVKYPFRPGKVHRREGLGALSSGGPASLLGQVPLNPTAQKGGTRRLLSMVLKHSIALGWFAALAAIRIPMGRGVGEGGWLEKKKKKANSGLHPNKIRILDIRPQHLCF